MKPPMFTEKRHPMKINLDTPNYLKVMTLGAATSHYSDSHANVKEVFFPDSGALLLVYEGGGMHSYAPGAWVSFFTDTEA